MLTAHPEAIEATDDLIHAISKITQADFDQITRLLYSTDASIYQMMPIGVVYPRDADEAAAVVEVAKQQGVPVLPRGGGSSLAGQAVGHALIIDFSRYMHNIIEVDTERQQVRTQPGISLGNMNRELAQHGLKFGPDPASADRATIGGILGNNSTGAHSILYGMTSDHILELDTILSDASRVRFDRFDDWATRGKRPGLEGELYRRIPGIVEQYSDHIATRYPKTFRHVAGYNLHRIDGSDPLNLARLLVGSEGTLGVTTEALLNLVPIPKVARLAMVHFSSLRAALESVPTLLESDPSAIEMMDKMLLDLAREKIEYRRLLTFVQGDPEIVLLVEYSGDEEKELDAGIARLRKKLATLNHHEPVVIISDPVQQANVWFVRKVGLGILMSIRGDAKPIPFIEDAAVPVEHLADYVTQIVAYAQEVGVARVPMYAHASAGCIHVRPMVNLKTADGVRQLRQIGEESLKLVMKYGGTVSGEHGDGIVRGEFAARQFGDEMVEAFRAVKRAFDPDNIMNPGKVVDVPKMDDESLLRYGTGYSIPLEPVTTTLNFDSDNGFAAAVEMCNGAGVCRKLGQGVMCPSFMATRNEKHTTRARANTLRAAMQGQLGDQGMTSKEVYDVMDLCLSCKACKSECPSAVDMAKLKAEFMHGYYQEHGTPIRARVFGNVARLNKFAQVFRPISNFFLVGAGSKLFPLLGIHPDRKLPALARQTFSAWYRKRPQTTSESEKEVILFHDTFMQHNYPHVGQAAVKVLESAGYMVTIVENHVCCGRPAISKGLLDVAAGLAQRNVELLAPYAKRGIPIIGCEPGCTGALADEYPDLVPGEDAKSVAKMTMMIDQFIVEEIEAGRFTLDLDDSPRRVLLHGHCNQKALFGTETMHTMLNLIPNCTVEEVESGCCGMAGSFGYETEHYELSITLAEMSLAPAVRAASAETIIAAPGNSCREQIEHTTSRKTLHPLEILAGAIID